MARAKKEKKRDLSHHERYGFAVPTYSAPAVGSESEAAKIPAVQTEIQVSGEAIYLKRELVKVFIILCLIAVSFVVLSSMIGKVSWLDKFISGLKIG